MLVLIMRQGIQIYVLVKKCLRHCVNKHKREREDKAIQEAESLAKKRDLVQEELENEKLRLSKVC
jgi:hypothetical protein